MIVQIYPIKLIMQSNVLKSMRVGMQSGCQVDIAKKFKHGGIG
jgi:hypothetical protein